MLISNSKPFELAKARLILSPRIVFRVAVKELSLSYHNRVSGLW